MVNPFATGLMLTFCQSGVEVPPPPPELPRQTILPNTGVRIEAPSRIIPPVTSDSPRGMITTRLVQDPKVQPPVAVPAPMAKQPAPMPAVKVGDSAPPAPVAPAVPAAEAPKAEEPKKEPEKGFFMAALEGTDLGKRLDCEKITISGWTEVSYNAASRNRGSNLPVAWTDRPNQIMLQQSWLRLEKAIDTESKEVTFGWRFDALFGTDYRFTLPRGIFNSQLLNSRGHQNYYGFDPVQFYGNAYLPDVFEGTEVRVGRVLCPWGYESVEAVTTPLVSRSYAFNSAPPFTHTGISFNPNFSKQLSGVFMIGTNDEFFDAGTEYRFIGDIAYTTEDKKDKATFGWSVGRGRFNTSAPFAPQTISSISENAGRNNLNVFDFVYTHEINECTNVAFEAIYGYQDEVPTTRAVGNIPGAMIDNNRLKGTAHWGSLVGYVNRKIDDKLGTTLRVEFFDDFEGQRTGFEGLYTEVTYGLQYKPESWLTIRPEVRYDYNNNSRPFSGGRDLFTFNTDLIIKW